MTKKELISISLVSRIRNSGAKKWMDFSQGKARGGDIVRSMATTSNAAMRKKTPFHVSIFLILGTKAWPS
jgi:hypothetical protein